jgi:hypothetical protein
VPDRRPSTQLCPLLRLCSRSDMTASLFQQQRTGALLTTLLPPGNTTCLSFARSPALSQTLIEGPQHSSIRSFVSTHDPTRRPRSPSSSAPALCSLHSSLRGTQLASPSHRVLLRWTLCREDQTTPLHSLLRPRLRSGVTAPLPPRQRTGALLPTVLPSGNNHLPLLRAESCSFADSARRPLNTASPTSPLPELRHGENTYFSAAHRRSTPTTSSLHAEPPLATVEQNSTLFVGPQHSSANSPEFAAPLTTTFSLRCLSAHTTCRQLSRASPFVGSLLRRCCHHTTNPSFPRPSG